MKIALLLIAVATTMSGATSAFDLIGGGCFQRIYSPAHLAQHPQQQVTTIALRRASEHDRSPSQGLQLRLTLRAWDELLTGIAYCAPNATTLECSMEGDAGGFRLEAARDGALRLVVAPQGISLEGESDVAVIAGDQGDDRRFLIPPARHCD